MFDVFHYLFGFGSSAKNYFLISIYIFYAHKKMNEVAFDGQDEV